MTAVTAALRRHLVPMHEKRQAVRRLRDDMFNQSEGLTIALNILEEEIAKIEAAIEEGEKQPAPTNHELHAESIESAVEETF